MKNIKRIIVKVGSSSIVMSNGKFNHEFISKLISTISLLMKNNMDVVLVTSGAIAVGISKLGLKKKPKDMALKQACAALGQASLMNEYEKYATIDNILCAQILVNHDDFENRHRMINLSNTFEALFENNILPIVNENDALSVDEIKVGDNDTLSSLLVNIVKADMLVLVSDIDGLYDKNPKVYSDAKKIDVVNKIDSTIEEMATCSTTNVGTGGMITKIKAGIIATNAGCDMVIISNDDINKLDKLLNGESIGTLFVSNEKILKSKEHWMIFNTYSKGSIVVDSGACLALKDRKSLLATGIKSISGEFEAGSVIIIEDESNNIIGKGITNFSSSQIQLVIGKHNEDVRTTLKSNKDEIIHASMLVLIEGDEYGKIK